MAEIFKGRYTADIESDFVVFLIGLRINKLWKIHKWWPAAMAMRPMLKTLAANREKGLLGAQAAFIGGPAVVQYWRSFEDLDRFARNADDPHLSAWSRFNREIGDSGDVGIWHETYLVRAGAYECVYGNMTSFGLAAATGHVPVRTKGNSAARRVGASEKDETAVPSYETPETPVLP